MITNDLSAPLEDRPYFGFAGRSKELRNVWGAGITGARI